MDEEIKNLHISQHRKAIEMYQEGVKSGINFAVERIMTILEDEMKSILINQLINEYSGLA